MKTIDMKIGRHTYRISEKDKFMDNGKSIQLLTQSQLPSDYGRRPHPVLPLREVKKVNAMGKVFHPHSYRDGVDIFSLVTGESDED